MKRLYVGRTLDGDYELGTLKKCWRPYDGFIGQDSYLDNFPAIIFEKYTGMQLKPGEIRRVLVLKFVLEGWKE